MIIDQRIASRLQASLETHMQSTRVPGLSISITGPTETIWSSAAGFSDASANLPITSETLFEVGSITKSFIAILLLQLQESGQVELARPVSSYLPWVHLPSKYEPLTIHHLLTHTAGLITGTEFTAEDRYVIWALRQTEISAPPGEYYHYSNDGYKILGLILESLMDQPISKIIARHIYRPLGIAHSEAAITHEIRHRLAMGYSSFYDDRPPCADTRFVPAPWLETATADGCIASTADDMAIYLRMLLRCGAGPDSCILSEDSFQQMITPMIEVPDDPPGTYYGYGLHISEEHGHTLIHHSGGMIGYRSAIIADLDGALGVAELSNGLGKPDMLAREALDVVRRSSKSRSLPSLPSKQTLKPMQDNRAYEGCYTNGEREFLIRAKGDQLMMVCDDQALALEAREAGFCVPHPDFALFLMRFEGVEDQITQAVHGADWYRNQLDQGPTTFNHPDQWLAYVGHYRPHNPWYSNFRVVLRKGALYLISPEGEEQPLVPLENNLFRIGEDARSPERLRLDTLINGLTIRANLSGADSYRTFTP